jgi:Domain of unknown function (DUF397)
MCGGNGECIEVMAHDGVVYQRKIIGDERIGPVFMTGSAEFAAFVAAVKAGEFDDLTDP